MPANFLSSALVLIPARNEGECIASTVREWRRLGALCVRVIDNGSTDDTAAAAREAGAEVLFEARRGYGAACWTGLRVLPPEAEWVLFSSADGSDRLSTDDIHRWDGVAASGADLVIGDRCSLPEARAHLKWVQRFGNTFCCFLIWLGWRRFFRDLGSLRLIHRNAFRCLELQDRGFGWNIEMQVRALELHLRIVEIPVQYYPRRSGVSKISGTFMGTVRAACGMAWVFARLGFGKFQRAPKAASASAPISACGHSVASRSPDIAP